MKVVYMEVSSCKDCPFLDIEFLTCNNSDYGEPDRYLPIDLDTIPDACPLQNRKDFNSFPPPSKYYRLKPY